MLITPVRMWVTFRWAQFFLFISWWSYFFLCSRVKRNKNRKLAQTALSFAELIAQQKISQKQLEDQLKDQLKVSFPNKSNAELKAELNYIYKETRGGTPPSEIFINGKRLDPYSVDLTKKLMQVEETLKQLEKYMLPPKDAMSCDDFLSLFLERMK